MKSAELRLRNMVKIKRSSFLILTILPFFINAQSNTTLCSRENTLYKEFSKQIELVSGVPLNEYESLTSCIYIIKINDSLDKQVFYAFKLKEIHSKYFLCVKTKSGKIRHLKDYEFSEFVKFILRHSSKNIENEMESCRILNVLIKMWCQDDFR